MIVTSSENYLKILNMFKHIVMIETILSILQVVNGIYIIIHNVDVVYSHLIRYKNNTIFRILVQMGIISPTQIRILV